MMRIAASALLVFAVLAGCSGSTPTDAGSDASSSSSTTGTLEQLPLEPQLEPSRRVTLYFTASGDLTPELPSEGTVPIGSATSGFVTGFQPDEFLSAPLANATLVVTEDIEVTAYLTSAGPQATNGAFDFAVQVGSTRASGLWHFVTTQPQAPGATQEVRVTLDFGDHLGLFVPVGESLRAIVLGQFGGESGEPRMRVGGQQASRIELTLANYTADPVGTDTEEVQGSATGTLTGIATVPSCDTAPGTTSKTHEVQLRQDALLLEVHLASQQGQDVDLELFDGTRVLASGHSALGKESVLLAADTLAGLTGRTLTFKATACGSGPINYEYEHRQLVPLGAEPPSPGT